MRFPVYLLLGCLLITARGPRESGGPDYIGAKRCRLCHRAAYDGWSRTAHRRATENIAPGSMQSSCLECHATGPAALQGVQCEACHGPGGDYWYPEVMIDPEKARLAGLVRPTESVCRSCHGSGLPEHASSFTMPDEAQKKRVIH